MYKFTNVKIEDIKNDLIIYTYFAFCLYAQKIRSRHIIQGYWLNRIWAGQWMYSPRVGLPHRLTNFILH